MNDNGADGNWTVTETDGILHFKSTSVGSDGTTCIANFEAFPAIEHWYAGRRRDEPIPLYAGPFTFTRKDQSAWNCHGVIRLDWYPLPQIVISGQRDEHPGADELMALFGSFDEYWVSSPIVGLPAAPLLPIQPAVTDTGAVDPAANLPTFQETTNVILAGATGFEQVTFLIPNGPDTSSGSEVALASKPGHFVSGHVQVQSSGGNSPSTREWTAIWHPG